MTVSVTFKPLPIEAIEAENGQGRTLRVSKTEPSGSKVKFEIISERFGELGTIRIPNEEFGDFLEALNDHADYLAQ